MILSTLLVSFTSSELLCSNFSISSISYSSRGFLSIISGGRSRVIDRLGTTLLVLVKLLERFILLILELFLQKDDRCNIRHM